MPIKTAHALFRDVWPFKITVVQTYGHTRIYLIKYLGQKKTFTFGGTDIDEKEKLWYTKRSKQTWTYLIQQYYSILQKSKQETPLLILGSFTKQVFE